VFLVIDIPDGLLCCNPFAFLFSSNKGYGRKGKRLIANDLHFKKECISDHGRPKAAGAIG
tara:strand:- start:384 stop:563 length:180 start_codon:yes stop_codon:yes gene_type:complete